MALSKLTAAQKEGLRKQSVLVAAINGISVDARNAAYTATRIARGKWMKELGYAPFEESAKARRGFGKRRKTKATVH